MNAYADLVTLKSEAYLNIATITDFDTQLRKLLEQSSRLLDKYCGRFFYCWEGTRYYPGAQKKLFLPDDLLSITSLKLDFDGDGTFEETMAATDYILHPMNGLPKLWLEINPLGSYRSFAKDVKKGVEITGVFGYGDGESATPYSDSGDSVQDNPLSASATTITVSDADNFAPGQTIRIESEQCYVTAYDTSTNKLTVKRGVNGTTAASHSQGANIYIYEYPMPIYQACLVITMRAWKRRESAYQDYVGSPETGQLLAYKGIDPDVAETVKEYRRWSYA
jgi:hypothetical protein